MISGAPSYRYREGEAGIEVEVLKAGGILLRRTSLRRIGFRREVRSGCEHEWWLNGRLNKRKSGKADRAQLKGFLKVNREH